MHLDQLKFHASDILRLLPEKSLSLLAINTNVDYYAKVLQGERLFYLLLYSLLFCQKLSQRKLEKIFESRFFCSLFNYSIGQKVAHSSISERLSTINVKFFQDAYLLFYDELHRLYSPREIKRMLLIRVDSTLVAETCNKLKKGFTIGSHSSKSEKPARKQVKYTMGYDGFAVQLAQVLTNPSFLSEDAAMPKVIQEMIKTDKEHLNFYVFDRGLTSLEQYDLMNKKQAKFVGRIRTNRKMETVRNLKSQYSQGEDLGKLELVEDKIVHLHEHGTRNYDPTEYRLIIARFKEERDTTRPQNKGKYKRVENEIYFITNDFELPAKDIAEIYRKRWDIEVFYRFLKQELSFSHFLSVNENGLQVILYMTLIASMLLMIYKRKNGLGYSMAQFVLDIEMQDFINNLAIELCGGDVTKLQQKKAEEETG